MTAALRGLLAMAGADFSAVDKSRESDIRRQALSTSDVEQEILHGHKGSREREAPGAPAIVFKDEPGEESGFSIVGGPRGGGGGGGHHGRGGGGGHRGGGGGGRHHGGGGGGGGGHHGRPGWGRWRRRGWGGPGAWGAVLDGGPVYYLDDSSVDECEPGQGPTLYMPSGEPVCPGDRRYEALARAHAQAHARGVSAVSGYFAVGDMLCSGVDLDAWKAANRVPLYPGQRIRWLIARSIDDKATINDAQAHIEGGIATASVFQKWFDPVALLPGDVTETEAGKIDNLKVLAMGTKDDMLTVAAKSGLVIEKRAEDLPGPLRVREPKVYALVEFVYRSMQTSMPWPVYNDATFSRKWCPVDCQVALSVAFKPSPDSKDVPKETGLGNPSTYLGVPSSEAITKAAADLASDLGKGAAEAAKGLMYVGLGAAVLIGGFLLIKNKT